MVMFAFESKIWTASCKDEGLISHWLRGLRESLESYCSETSWSIMLPLSFKLSHSMKVSLSNRLAT